MKFITRERPKIEPHCLAYHEITDLEAEFIYAATDQVSELGATPFDIPGANGPWNRFVLPLVTYQT